MTHDPEDPGPNPPPADPPPPATARNSVSSPSVGEGEPQPDLPTMSPAPPHPSGDRLEAFAARELGSVEAEALEAHLAGCARCRTEVEGWALLFSELEALPAQDPSTRFADQVMARLGSGVRVSLPVEADAQPAEAGPARAILGKRIRWARGKADGRAPGLVRAARSRIAGLLRGIAGPLLRPSAPDAVRHLTPAGIQDYLEGQLTLRTQVRVREHLARCPDCTGEVAAWSRVMAHLDTLPRLGPSSTFADRVMARVPVEAIAQVVANEKAPRTILDLPGSEGRKGILARLLPRLLPQTRGGWMAMGSLMAVPTLAGVAIVAVLALNPLVGSRDLLTFAAWKLSDALAGAGQSALSLVGQTSAVRLLGEIFVALAQTPVANRISFLLGAALAMGAALFVMYRNLYRPLRTGESHVQHSR